MNNSIHMLQEQGRLKVSRVAQGRAGDDLSLALFDVASGDRKAWTLPDWEAVLSTLDNSNLTISQWLKRQEQQHGKG